jgi:cobalt-zinc-cadmium efflux system outer membrane protein
MEPRSTASPMKLRGRGRPGQGPVGLLLVGLLAASCARYHPRPIVPVQSLEDFEARRLDAPELESFLGSHQGVTDWPPASWDLHSLTLSAFYYSPVLDVARAQWGVARGGVITAGGRPNPSVTAALGYNSTTPTDVVTPWIPEVALDIPIEIAGKRGIRIAQARQLSEAARLNILSAAWQVRSRVRGAFLDLYAARATDSLLTVQQEIQVESVRILERQLAVGEVSAYALTEARIALARSRLAALDASLVKVRARSELADAIGLSPTALDGITYSFQGFEQVSPDLPSGEIRRRALVNRSDILGALAEYEATQAALQLEIRKQYPDISLGPGYQLDQTDSKWTLGLSLTLPIFNRNRGPIAEAEARREEAAAHFLALQSRVLADLEGAVAAADSAFEQVRAADLLMDQLRHQQRSAEAAYRVGEISRLELLGRRAEIVTIALSRLQALVAAQQAIGALEDAMQSPIDVGEWVLEQPQRVSGQGQAKDER